MQFGFLCRCLETTTTWLNVYRNFTQKEQNILKLFKAKSLLKMPFFVIVL